MAPVTAPPFDGLVIVSLTISNRPHIVNIQGNIRLLEAFARADLKLVNVKVVDSRPRCGDGYSLVPDCR